MKNADYPEEVLTGAYKIFREEVSKHLEETRIIFSDESFPSVPEIQDARIKFHKIKGGAGFFGLDEVESSAGQIEKMLKESGIVVNSHLDEVRELLETLERQISKMPEK